jgi:glycosyltransferase involved in cell wall biosynthesis
MKLSLIIPFYNEEENIQPLVDTIEKTVNPLGMTYEVIFVDDGSTDNSLNILKGNLKSPANHVKIIELRRNYGQTTALSAGIDNSIGEIIVLLDADMQNDPADIPLLLKKLDEGFDVVSGWRKDRKDTFLTRTLPSMIANSLISKVTGVKLHDYGCTLKAYKREFLGTFHLYGEMHRFIPVYAADAGAKVTEVVVHHHPRKFGKSKYGIDRTLKVILDLVTVKFLMSYSAKPMRLFGGVGLALMTLSIGTLLFLIIRRIIFFTSILGSPFFQVSITVFILGFISMLMGLIAELLMRTYYESQDKPTYAVRSIEKRIKE